MFRHKLFVVLSLGVVTGCFGGTGAGFCIFTPGWGRGLGSAVGEQMLSPDRPDEVADAGKILKVSGKHETGRLVLSFDGPPVSGKLPRVFASLDGGCDSAGDFAHLVRVADGGSYVGIEELNATLVVTQIAAVDGGKPTLFRLTGITTVPNPEDGGTRAVADRDLHVLLP